MASQRTSQNENPGVNMDASFVDTSLLGVAVSLPTIATVAVILRFIARRAKGHGKYRADDWFVLATLALCWGHSINTIAAGAIGGINTIKVPPQDYAQIALRTLWISGFFLITALFTVKISILLFYNHLFSINSRFRSAVIVMMVVLSCWYISSFVCQLLATDPIDANWKNAATAHHRFNFDGWYISYSGLSILFDIIILLFPVPMIRSLHVNLKQKLSILGIFWLGAFVCVAAIIRFVFLYESIYKLTSLGQNMYSSITYAFIWAEVEPNAAVIAACLPTYGPLFAGHSFLSNMSRSIHTISFIPSAFTKSKQKATSNSVSNGYYQLDGARDSTRSGTATTEHCEAKNEGGERLKIPAASYGDLESQR